MLNAKTELSYQAMKTTREAEGERKSRREEEDESNRGISVIEVHYMYEYK